MTQEPTSNTNGGVGAAGPIGSAGARGVPVPADQPYGQFHPAVMALKEKFGADTLAVFPLVVNRGGTSDQACVRVRPEMLLAVMRFLRDDPQCRFDLLSDVTCVDYLYFPNATDRYGVTYTLVSTSMRHRLWAKCFANDPDPSVPSVTSIWKGANWPEREVYDMFGVKFEGHPDLRRILLWDGFGAYPLRKDYPVQGLGEWANYEVIGPETA